MKRDAVTVVLGVAVGLAVVYAVKSGKGWLKGVMDAVAAIPGQIVQAAQDAVGSLEDGTSVVSDPYGGGFVKESPDAGRMPAWAGLRDTAPLTAYFLRVGNTYASRQSAESKGWTKDEIGLAVAAMTNGQVGIWTP